MSLLVLLASHVLLWRLNTIHFFQIVFKSCAFKKVWGPLHYQPGLMSNGSNDWKRITNQHLRARWLVDIWKYYIRIWNRYLFPDFGCDFSSRTHRNGSANDRSQFLHQSPSGFTQWRRMPRYFLGRISGWIFIEFVSEIFCCYYFVVLRVA